jgi:fibronectin-binding autotransporter adhesin
MPDGTWAVDASGNWSLATNWSGSTIADGADSTANFTNNITATRTVTLDTAGRVIGNMVFSDAGALGSIWTLSGGNTLQLDRTTGSPTITTTTLTRIILPLTGSDGFTHAGAQVLNTDLATHTLTGDIYLTGTNFETSSLYVAGSTVRGASAVGTSSFDVFQGTGGVRPKFFLVNDAGGISYVSTTGGSVANDFAGDGFILLRVYGTGARNYAFTGDLSGMVGTNTSSTNNAEIASGFILATNSPASGGSARSATVTLSTLPAQITHAASATTAAVTNVIVYDGTEATPGLRRLYLYNQGASSWSSSNVQFQGSGTNPVNLDLGIIRGGPGEGQSLVYYLGGTHNSNTVSGVISATNTTFRKTGTGRWIFNGTNTYNGQTFIDQGVLSAQSDAAFGSTGGQLSITGVGGTLELAGDINLNKSGTALSLVSTHAANALQVPAGGGDNTLTVAAITLNSTAVVDIATGAALRIATVSSVTTGTGFGVTKNGGGEYDLNAYANTFTGAVAVNAGTLTVAASCAPSSNGPLGNATSAVTVSGTLKFDGASNSTISRSVQLQGSTPALDASGTHHVHFSNVSQASGTRTLTLKGTGTSNNQLQSALGNGSGGTTGLTKDGAGKWSLTGTPSYTGLTTVNAGTLNFAGQDLTLTGDVSMAGGVLANGTLDNTLVTDVTFTGGTVQALLDGASTVTASSGTGRLYPVTSTGGNTYNGTTTVQVGATLELVTDSNPGTVGDGKVTGASNVTVSGTLATGSGVNQRGQARYGGNLTFAAGSVLAIGAAA